MPGRMASGDVTSDRNRKYAIEARADFETVPPEILAMGNWLETFNWTDWCTLTFDAAWGPTGPSPSRARFHTEKWLTNLPGEPPGFFFCVETGRLGRVHCHALLRINPGPMAAPRDALYHGWRNRFGRCRIRAYDPELGASHYVAKYLTKAPLHWDLGGPIMNR